ncbi:MAG: DUF3179 domain-containing (seleno)protein [Planctomycetota bacterium]
MPGIIRSSLPVVAFAVAGVGYVVIAGKTGFCPACAAVTSAVTSAVFTEVKAEPSASPDEHPSPNGHADDYATFRRTVRPGSVDIEAEYNLEDLQVPQEQIHTLLPRDAIPALTDPPTESLEDAASWLQPSDRVIVATLPGEEDGEGEGATSETLIVPLHVLDFHEVVNTTLAGEPVALTYCPLCDSATVFSRRVVREDAEGERVEQALEFGVSGALFNSNVLMYDQTDRGLWSQLAGEALSGPLVGTALDHLPVRIETFADAREAHPEARSVSRDTGFERPYGSNPYTRFFETDGLLVDVESYGEALPKKTLGIGVRTGDRAWFVVATSVTDGMVLETPEGPVVFDRSGAGVSVRSHPKGVATAQTFYYAWSAFYPDLELIWTP